MAALVGDLSRTGTDLFSAGSEEILADFDISEVLTSEQKTDTMDDIIAKYNAYAGLVAANATLTTARSTSIARFNDLIAIEQTLQATSRDMAVIRESRQRVVKYTAMQAEVAALAP